MQELTAKQVAMRVSDVLARIEKITDEDKQQQFLNRFAYTLDGALFAQEMDEMKKELEKIENGETGCNSRK